MTSRSAVRAAAAAMVVLLTATVTNVPAASAITPPTVDPGSVPPDAPPRPEQPMRQSNECAHTMAAAEPDVSLPNPCFAMLNITTAWQYSTGRGVSVALIDTGVTPSPRLPVVAGGDYITGGDGLTDCDAHGTIVASLITAAPVPAPGAPDGVAGVAPDATLISIRQSSRAYEPDYRGGADGAALKKAGTVATLARAIVHAANSGAAVINVSVTACVSAADPLDQRAIGAAVWYAATVKNAVIVAAAGNANEDGCAQNPAADPTTARGLRDWTRVRTVSSPSWFSDYVLSVGAVDTTGAPIATSLAGPWVGVALSLGWALGYGSSEWTHAMCPLRAPKNRYQRWVRRHHFHHHFGHPMANHGVTVGWWDRLFGTEEPPGTVKIPRRLAQGLGIAWSERSLTAADLAAADEILLTSTPSCILPATRFNGRSVGTGRPGPVFHAILEAWNGLVGLDIADQARQHHHRLRA